MARFVPVRLRNIRIKWGLDRLSGFTATFYKGDDLCWLSCTPSVKWSTLVGKPCARLQPNVFYQNNAPQKVGKQYQFP